MLSKLNSLREKNEDGFTLIELLIVVVIIGILAAIAIPIFLNQQKAAIAGTVKSDVRNTVTNIATYLTKNNSATNADLILPANVPIVKSGGSEEVITIFGDWKTYSVLGTNTNVGTPATSVAAVRDNTGGAGYAFSSQAGQYYGSGGF